MEGPCLKSTRGDGEHRLEFQGESHGERHWLCLDCGEIVTEYHDVGAGG